MQELIAGDTNWPRKKTIARERLQHVLLHLCLNSECSNFSLCHALVCSLDTVEACPCHVESVEILPPLWWEWCACGKHISQRHEWYMLCTRTKSYVWCCHPWKTWSYHALKHSKTSGKSMDCKSLHFRRELKMGHCMTDGVDPGEQLLNFDWSPGTIRTCYSNVRDGATAFTICNRHGKPLAFAV